MATAVGGGGRDGGGRHADPPGGGFGGEVAGEKGVLVLARKMMGCLER